jgi:hypothetical protein
MEAMVVPSVFQVRKRISIFRDAMFMLKLMIVLPRQARDKHRWKAALKTRETCGCVFFLQIFEIALKDILKYPDMKPEVFQCVREIGTCVFEMSAEEEDRKKRKINPDKTIN